jgi:hypothetical protein
MLAGLPKAQFTIPEVNLLGSNPADLSSFRRMLDGLIANHIVPIIITYTYRTDANFNLLVDQYNVALKQLAQSMKLPLIDLNGEMLAQLPFSQWSGRFLSDGVHYTNGGRFTATSSPYINGGDPATHTTGTSLTYNGYGLKGWRACRRCRRSKHWSSTRRLCRRPSLQPTCESCGDPYRWSRFRPPTSSTSVASLVGRTKTHVLEQPGPAHSRGSADPGGHGSSLQGPGAPAAVARRQTPAGARLGPCRRLSGGWQVLVIRGPPATMGCAGHASIRISSSCDVFAGRDSSSTILSF